MKFKDRLLEGTLVKRYKRFFADINHNNHVITAHCPNSGSMMGLLDKENKVWFSRSNDPKRKLKYTLELIEVKNKLTGINTIFANRIVFEALREKKIESLKDFNNIKKEVKFSKNTRFDFLITKNKKKLFLEVKNVTLFRDNNVAEFPDAVTARGTKHLNELVNAKQKGFESCILYLVQRQNCNAFKIAADIDKEYKIAFDYAVKSGVKIICYDCKISNEEVILNNQIKIIK